MTLRQPTIGRIVHYFDREEVVNADGQGRPPEPFAATITRVLKDDQGKPTDVVTLSVLDPELGCSVQRDVHPGDDYDKPVAGLYYWPPIIEAGLPEKPTHLPAGAHPADRPGSSGPAHLGAHPDQDLPGKDDDRDEGGRFTGSTGSVGGAKKK